MAPLHRHKWFHVTVGITLIVLSAGLTIGWQFLAAPNIGVSLRWVLHFFGTLLLLLLTGGLVLIVILLLRELRLNERQSNFVSAVTHELKTPVASLRLYLDTLELRELAPARRLEFYRTMRQDLDRLNATINNVLNAAMYTDRPVLDPQPLDFAKLVRRAVDLTRTRHQLTPEAMRYDGPGELRLRGDATGLETAVLNLLDNAVKYSRERVDVQVELRVEAESRARLRVRDHGIGIGRTHLALIFNRFYRIGAEVRRNYVGTGLGLFIVKSVVARHRGQVTAESAGPERGSTFTLVLPGVCDVDGRAVSGQVAEQGGAAVAVPDGG
jgi:signal transduction histidine kinase